MSGSTSPVAQVLGASTTVAGGAALLPFTGGSNLVTYLILTTMGCASVILLSKVVRLVAVRFIA